MECPARAAGFIGFIGFIGFVNRARGHSQLWRLINVRPTDVADPEYFHKVVDCQWACPAHTPVPEYIRLIGSL